jgi:hypothetical protein
VSCMCDSCVAMAGIDGVSGPAHDLSWLSCCPGGTELVLHSVPDSPCLLRVPAAALCKHEMPLTEFERHGGFAGHKKWRKSISVSLTRWAAAGGNGVCGPANLTAPCTCR